MKIPQLEATITYKTYISSPDVDEAIAGASVGGCGKGVGNTTNVKVSSDIDDILQGLYQNDSQHVGITSEIYDEFEDDSYIAVTGDSLLLKIEEFNAPYTNDNFNIEVFELTSSVDIAGNIEETWAPLYFRVQKDEFGNYYSQPEDDGWLWEQTEDLNSTLVNYFIEVNADRQIPEEDLCPVLARADEKLRDLYEVDIVCPDLDLIRRSHQLGAEALEESFMGTVKEEDIEGCD
jgi:hypothetical protein